MLTEPAAIIVRCQSRQNQGGHQIPVHVGGGMIACFIEFPCVFGRQDIAVSLKEI